MEVAEWQKRLEDNFTYDNVVGGHLSKIIDQEKSYGNYFATTFLGQSVLIDSFQSFFIETYDLTYSWLLKKGWPIKGGSYGQILVFYVILFKGFRACENLLINGYPLDGYSLLRDLKDRTIFLGAIANNITTFLRIYGLENASAVSDAIWKELKSKRKKEEHRVLGKMLRQESGLPPDIVSELIFWEQLFNEEVHGSKFSLFFELGKWIKTNKGPSIGPVPDKRSMGMYMCRAVEIGWMIVKLLTYLQPEKHAFGRQWLERQMILDDSFRIVEKSLSDAGKKIGDAFIYFIDNKFKFGEDFHYFEADGTA